MNRCFGGLIKSVFPALSIAKVFSLILLIAMLITSPISRGSSDLPGFGGSAHSSLRVWLSHACARATQSSRPGDRAPGFAVLSSE